MEREDEVPPPGYFLWRRIPGTGALAITNLIAADLLFSPAQYEVSPVFTVARMIFPSEVWAFFFGLSGLFLLIAVLTRRWFWLNIGSVMSLFAWTAISVAAFSAWLLDDVQLSPIAGALFFWMIAGQAAMLIVPLVALRKPPS